MDQLANQALPALQRLQYYDEAELYTELGSRLEALRRDPSMAGQFDIEVDRGELEALGVMDNVKAFGGQFFERFSGNAYAFMCGSEAVGTEERQAVERAFSMGQEAVGAALTALLVAYVGIAPAIAVVVAAIAVKLFFRSAYEAMCDVWNSNLPGQPVVVG